MCHHSYSLATDLYSVCVFVCAQAPEKANCLAILVFASMLWALEAIPLFTTAMIVPVLVVTLRVSQSSHE